MLYECSIIMNMYLCYIIRKAYNNRYRSTIRCVVMDVICKDDIFAKHTFWFYITAQYLKSNLINSSSIIDVFIFFCCFLSLKYSARNFVHVHVIHVTCRMSNIKTILKFKSERVKIQWRELNIWNLLRIQTHPVLQDHESD